ncbi:MAG: ABC-F family ATP-binding cassette domain-containing protein [Chitinophagales bacterium]
MALLQVKGLTKYWGADLLFGGVDLLVNEGEKVGLVGRNGTGKTTLLRLLTRRLEPDGGSVYLAPGCRVGYLTQDPEFTPGLTVLEEAESVFAGLLALERDLRALEARMASTASEEALAALMDQYARATARFETSGGYELSAKVKAVLFGLGFTAADLTKPAAVLSGGQKVRLGLAKLLLDEPGLLLLDEPTNHLDLAATEWLEGYLKSLDSAALVISHDRYFLDRVTTKTLELEDGRGELYPGNFSWSREEKLRRLAAALEAYERRQKEMAKLREFYEKWRSTPTHKNQAMSRKKQLDKLAASAPDKPKTRHKAMKLRFDLDRASGNDVLQLQEVAFHYPGAPAPVFAGVTASVKKGDRVALVGPNGAGKTTLLKVLAGLHEPSAGSLRWGAGVELGYFSQDLDELDYSHTCLEEIYDLPGFTIEDARSLLGRFLFSGEDAEKPIAKCSGGERNRLVLAKLTVSGANVLLLDEPTNHLDLESKGVLEEALLAYPGTIIFVSHDRFFIDRIATKVWEFGPATGPAQPGAACAVTAYPGNYTAYKAEKERLALLKSLAPQAAAPAPAGRAAAAPPPAKPSVQAREEARQAERGRKKEERAAAEQLRRVEETIQRLEERKSELESLLGDPELYRSENGHQLGQEYSALLADLERLYAEWELLVG